MIKDCLWCYVLVQGYILALIRPGMVVGRYCYLGLKRNERWWF